MGEREYRLNSDWQKSIGDKPVLYDVAEDLMIFCIAYPPLLLVGRFFEEGAELYFKLFILLVSMLAMTVNRKKSKRIYTFVLILIGIVALTASLPLNLPIKIEMTGAVLVAALVSAGKLIHILRRKRCKEDPTMQSGWNVFLSISVPGIGIPCFYITYMISYALHRREMLAVCLVSMAILLFGFATYTHKVGTFRLTEANRGQPFLTQKIQGFSRLFVLYTAVAASAIGGLTYLFIRFTGLGIVDDWIIYVLTYARTGADFKPAPPAETSNPIDFTTILQQIGIRPSPRFMLILDKVLEGAFWIVFIASVLIGFLLILRLLFRLFKKSREHINEEVRSTLSIRNVTDEMAAKIKKSKIAALFTGSSNNMKIRKLYYRLVKKYRTKGVPIVNADSPTEIESKIEQCSGAKMRDVTQVYQKARYGFEECDREDVERVKTEVKHKDIHRRSNPDG